MAADRSTTACACPVVFDNLIASGDLPPLIGIFVDPGHAARRVRHGAESLRARLRIRLPERPLFALPAGGTDSRGGQEVQPLEGSQRSRAFRRQHRSRRRVHGRLEPPRPVSSRAQLHRHLRRHERRRRPARPHPQDRAEADPHLLAGRQERPRRSHRTLRHLLCRKLAHQQPGDVRSLPIRGLRRQARDRRGRPQHETGRGDHARRPALVVARIPEPDRGRGARGHWQARLGSARQSLFHRLGG